MSVYYLPNPKNPKAMGVFDEYGSPPMAPFVDGVMPFVFTLAFGLMTWLLWIDGSKQGWAIACGVGCALSIICAIAKFEPLLRRKRRRLRKLLAKGEIVALSEDVTTAFRKHLHAAGMITSQEDRVALLWSFDGLSRLAAVLQKVDSAGDLSAENLRQRAETINNRTRLMVQAFCDEAAAVAAGRQKENELSNHWVAEILRGEVDG